MTERGRPRSERAANAVIVRIKMRLYQGEDDDLIAYFEEIPAGLRAAATKQALRSGMAIAQDTDTVEDAFFQPRLSSLIE